MSLTWLIGQDHHYCVCSSPCDYWVGDIVWNIIGHEASTVGWEISYHLATISGVILTWVKAMRVNKKRVINNLVEEKKEKNE